jgi:hypothetical protein
MVFILTRAVASYVVMFYDFLRAQSIYIHLLYCLSLLSVTLSLSLSPFPLARPSSSLPFPLIFHQGQHPVFPVQDIAYLDIDNCLLCLQRIPMPMKYINILNRGLSINVNMTHQKINNNAGCAMDCNENCSPTDSDTDGQSSVRTITPTSTADLSEERSNNSKLLGKNLSAE